MKKKALLLSALILLVSALQQPVLAQKAEQSAAPHQNYRIDKVQRQQRVQISEQKHFRISYQPNPDPIPLNQHFRMTFLVQDLSGKGLDGLKLKVDAGMPEHNHGMSVKPKLKALGKGRYEVRGLLFHMPGYWEVYLDTPYQDKLERTTFGMTLEMKPAAHQHNHH